MWSSRGWCVRQWHTALLDSVCALCEPALGRETLQPNLGGRKEVKISSSACMEVVCEQEPRQVMVRLRS